jgi:hypothetical protein
LSSAPGFLSDRLTDSAGVLGGDTAAVREALDQLSAETPIDLFVVFVDSFDGMGATEWVNKAAVASDLSASTTCSWRWPWRTATTTCRSTRAGR